MRCYMELIKEYALEKNIDIYEVGGAVRDKILGRKISDFDFAVSSDCHKIAEDIGNKIGGSYVNMHRNTARVVRGSMIFDFSNFKGKTIVEDLAKRDFTINSIAIDLITGKIIDIKNGMEDIKRGIINITYEEAFEDDPIRMLRAVRLAGELGYNIDRHTGELVIKNAPLLNNCPGERIIDEILKIFSLENSQKYIEILDELGLLNEIFPVMEPMKAVGKCDFHTVDAYTHSLLTLKSLEDNFIRVMDSKWGIKIKEHFLEGISGRTRLSIFKLGTFLHDIGKPSAMRILEDKISFKGHDITGREEFKKISENLPLSNVQKRIIEDIIMGHMKILVLYKSSSSPGDIFNFFKVYRENTIDVILSSLFDFTATRELLDEDKREIKNFWNFAMNLIDKYYTNREKNYKIIDGKEIIQLTGANGKIVGEILRKIEEEIFMGRIENKEEAIDFVKKSSMEKEML